MRTLLALAVTVALLFSIFLLWRTLDPTEQDRRAAAARLERERIALQIEAEKQQAARDAATAPAYTLLGILYAALPLAVAIVGGAVAVDMYAQRRTPLARPTAQGFLPVPRAAIEQGQLVDAMKAALTDFHTTQLAAAGRPVLPQTLTYAPHYSARNDAPLLPVGDTRALPTAPTFAQLVSSGFQARADRMLLGYGTDGPIYGGIESLLSTAIAGRPNQGKSTTLRFVYAQALQIGAQVAILDPHGSILDAVNGGPSQLVASSAAELDDLAAWLGRELDNRLAAYRAGQRAFDPLLVLADEFPALSLSSKAAVAALGRVVLEARKVGGYALISGQGLPAATFGGRLVRDALSSRIIHKTSQAEGQRAGLDKASAALLECLEPGRAILDGPVQPQIVAIPLTVGGDLRCVAPRQDARSAPVAPDRYDALPQGATARYSVADSGTTPLRAATEDLPESAHTEAHAPIRSASVAVSEAERVSILSARERLTVEGQQPSRRAVCEAVFGTTGGAGYRKVQAVLAAPHGEV